jgi:outer membrane receptor protein involved in Fe transport
MAAPHRAMEGQNVDDTTKIEEIVVTAQKRKELLSQTPLAVSALSRADLAKLDMHEFSDFATYVPGISFTTSGAGQTQINLRGVTTGPAIAPTVGIYIDDAAYGGTSAPSRSAQLALDPAVFDLERIEALRGPQGTLYGASTMGGLIKYVTARPDLKELTGDGTVDLSVTRHGGFNQSGHSAVNLPLAPGKLAVRLGGFYDHDAGYIENVSGSGKANHSKAYGGKIDILLEPTEALTFRIWAFGQNIDRAGRAEADFSLMTHVPLYGPLSQNRIVAEPFNQHYRLVSGTVTYDFGGPTFTSITSYQTAHTIQSQDVSGLYGPLLGGFGIVFPKYAFTPDVNTKKFTEEARLASSPSGRLQWLAGVFYTYEKNTDHQTLGAQYADGTPVPINLFTADLPSKYQEIAVFGDITYYVMSKLDVTLGLRVAHNNQEYEQMASGLLAGPEPARQSHETVSTFLINPRYKFNDHAMIYARAASGYRPGGPNAVGTDPATGLPLANPTFKADKLWSYEVGFKVATPDRKLSLDAAFYDIEWHDLQVIAVHNGFGVGANAGRARSRGIEVTLAAQPASGLSLGANLSYTDAKLVEDAPDLGGISGERLPDAPRVTTALTADYSFPLQGNLTGFVGGSFRYLGDRYASFDGSMGVPQYHLPSYTVTDLRAGLEWGGVASSLYVKNLFDKRGEMSAFTGFSLAGGPAQLSIIKPRTIGIRTSVRF